MSSRVRVLGVSHVPGDRTTSPSAPAVVKLSFFDALYVTMAPIQRLFFYDGPDLPPFPSIVHSLRSSLAVTLASYPLLAGKLTYRASCQDLVFDCSPAAVAPGVRFVEAEYRGDMRRLTVDDEHHAREFALLMPEVEAPGTLPAPVLAVQVTRPAAGDGRGAAALGVSVHHTVADGRSVWQFMKAWTAAAREGSPVTPGLPPPVFDRAAIRHPAAEGLTRKFMRAFATDDGQVVDPFPFPVPVIDRQRRRTFLLSPDKIQSLKQRVSRVREAGNGEVVEPPSAYVAVSSLVWTSIVRAKSTELGHADDVYFLLSADCRCRIRPPVDEGYFGNCVMGCCARAAVGDLLCGGDDEGLAHAAAAIQRAIREGLEDPLGDVEGRLALRRGLPADRVTVMGSSNRFMGYDTDFGWGAPTRVELVSITLMEEVSLLGARDGGVQVSVALDGAYMEAVVAAIQHHHQLSETP